MFWFFSSILLHWIPLYPVTLMASHWIPFSQINLKGRRLKEVSKATQVVQKQYKSKIICSIVHPCLSKMLYQRIKLSPPTKQKSNKSLSRKSNFILSYRKCLSRHLVVSHWRSWRESSLQKYWIRKWNVLNMIRYRRNWTHWI